MIASRVTPLAEEEEAEVDGAEGVGGAAVPDRLKCSCASLCLTVVAFMAHITWKWSKTRKWNKKMA